MNILTILCYWIIELYDRLTVRSSYKKLVTLIKNSEPGSVLEWQGHKREAMLLYKFLRNPKNQSLPSSVTNQFLEEIKNVLQDEEMTSKEILHIRITM